MNATLNARIAEEVGEDDGAFLPIRDGKWFFPAKSGWCPAKRLTLPSSFPRKRIGANFTRSRPHLGHTVLDAYVAALRESGKDNCGSRGRGSRE